MRLPMYIGLNNSTYLVSCLAPFTRYGGLLVKFSPSTEGACLYNALVRANPWI